MLSRASLPLLRLQSARLASRPALAATQVRYLRSKDYFLGKDTDYKLPDSASQPSWQQKATFASDQSKEPLRKVPRVAGEPVPETSEDTAEHDPGRIRSNPSRHSEESTPFQEPEILTREDAASEPIPQPPRPPPEPPQDSTQSDTEPQQPLPDLTRGIPSTLAYELEQAQAGKQASKASLNITENPSESEEAPGSYDGGSRDARPHEYVSTSDRKKSTAAFWFYTILGAGTVFYTMYLGRNWDTEEEEKRHADAPSGWGAGLFYNRIKARMGSTMSYYNDPMAEKLLPDEEKDPAYRMPFTLVLSLEDLLVHSEWSRANGWRIAKRPGVDYFLRYLNQYYELVLFTTQPYGIADQVLRKLDPFMIIRFPLFREATKYEAGVHVKDLSYLNRDLSKVIIIDTNADHVKKQPENAIILPKWTGDPKDQTLIQMIPFLEYVATMGFDDSRTVLKSFEGKFIPAEFARREKLLREKFEAQQAEKNKGKKPKRSFGLGSIFKQQSPDALPSAEDAMAEGKMLWDVIRERGQRQYQELEKKIQTEGDKWLKEREEEEKRLQEQAMKDMARGGFMSGWFGGGGGSDKK